LTNVHDKIYLNETKKNLLVERYFKLSQLYCINQIITRLGVLDLSRSYLCQDSWSWTLTKSNSLQLTKFWHFQKVDLNHRDISMDNKNISDHIKPLLLQWKPLNVITDNVIIRLLWSNLPRLICPKSLFYT